MTLSSEAMLGGASGSSRAAIKKALLAMQLTRKAGERRESREERHEELPQRSPSGPSGAGPTLPAIKAGRRVLHPSRPDGGAGVDASALPSNTEGGIFRGSTVGDKMRKRERLKWGLSQGESGEVELGMALKHSVFGFWSIASLERVAVHLGLVARCAQGRHCQAQGGQLQSFDSLPIFSGQQHALNLVDPTTSSHPNSLLWR